MKLETLRKFPSVNALYLQVATQLLCTRPALREALKNVVNSVKHGAPFLHFVSCGE